MESEQKKTLNLLESLAYLYPESSKNTLKKWIRAKRVFLDNSIALDINAPVNPGSKITLGAKKEFCRYNIEILYEDSDLVVIYKPENLLSVATDNEQFRTAHDYLKRRVKGKRVYPVHRLDRDTSGVMVFAYTERAKNHLKNQFEAHSIYREYRAIVHGHMEIKKGRWQSYLIEDGACKMHETIQPEGAKLAITDYEVLAESRALSLVKLVLKTGKKNQIRVQAAKRNHPLLGDEKYGKENDTFPRLALHAIALDFIHPSKEKLFKFTYPFPKELNLLFSSKLVKN